MAVQFSVSQLDFISNTLSFADWCSRESVGITVEYFTDRDFLLEMHLSDASTAYFNKGQVTEISCDFNSAYENLLTVPQPEKSSRKYKV